jgi:cell shape-determining protein MreD
VPVVISKFFSKLSIPINIGQKSGPNFLFFAGLCFFGWGLEWITQNTEYFHSPLLAVGFSVVTFSVLSLGLAFLLGLTELRFFKAIQNKISGRF